MGLFRRSRVEPIMVTAVVNQVPSVVCHECGHLTAKTRSQEVSHFYQKDAAIHFCEAHRIDAVQPQHHDGRVFFGMFQIDPDGNPIGFVKPKKK